MKTKLLSFDFPPFPQRHTNNHPMTLEKKIQNNGGEGGTLGGGGDPTAIFTTIIIEVTFYDL